MRAMTVAVIAVLAIANRVFAHGSSSAELRVAGENTGVDNVRRHTRAGTRVAVRVAERERALIDAVNAPGRVVLVGLGVCFAVTLDIGDPHVRFHSTHETRSQLASVSLESVLVNVANLCT